MRVVLARAALVLAGAAAIVAAALGVGVWLVTRPHENACDPGNRRLAALRHDRAVRLLAPRAVVVDEAAVEASTSPFSRSCSSPQVVRRFRFRGSSDSVYAFYKRELPRVGWRYFRNAGLSIVYRKRYDHWRALLAISSSPPEFSVEIFGKPAVAMTPE